MSPITKNPGAAEEHRCTDSQATGDSSSASITSTRRSTKLYNTAHTITATTNNDSNDINRIQQQQQRILFIQSAFFCSSVIVSKEDLRHNEFVWIKEAGFEHHR